MAKIGSYRRKGYRNRIAGVEREEVKEQWREIDFRRRSN
jgi:hypothetical protein